MKGAALGVWEFVVGDDWRVAVGVVAMLATTALIAALDLPAWWLSPAATLAILWRAVGRSQRAAASRSSR